MRPCIIWAVARVGSTTLGRALSALNEPFQQDGDKFASPSEINDLCSTHQPIKHLYEECPDESNIALAQAADREGYRHIHLIRFNELARLVSRNIATQMEAWTPEVASIKFAELRAGRAKLAPLDILHLLDLNRMGREHWQVIHQHIKTPVLWVSFEDITNKNCSHRRATLHRIAGFLGLSSKDLHRIDSAMVAGGQDTQSVWEFVPNINELRLALAYNLIPNIGELVVGKVS